MQEVSCLAADDRVAGSPARFAASHRWKVLGVGVAANASFIAASNGLPATAIWLRSAYRLDNAQLGLLLGALGLGVALSELPWGSAADRWGDRRVLLWGLTITGLTLLLMALCAAPSAHRVPALSTMLVFMGVLGAAGGSVNGASGRAIMRWFGEGERGLAMSIRQTAVPLGGGLGALLLPSLAVDAGFRWVYGVLAVACLATVGLTWRWLHEPPMASVPGVKHAAARRGGPLRDPGVWRIAMAIGILCAPQFAILSFASVFLHDALGVGLRGITFTLCAIQVGAMVARVWSGHHTDRHGNRSRWLRRCTTLAAATFLPLVACAALDAALPAALTMLAVIVAGISVSAWHGVAYTELASQAGAERAGTALGLANTLVFAAYFVTPTVIPHMLAHGSWPGVWFAAGACALVALPLFSSVKRLHRGR